MESTMVVLGDRLNHLLVETANKINEPLDLNYFYGRLRKNQIKKNNLLLLHFYWEGVKTTDILRSG